MDNWTYGPGSIPREDEITDCDVSDELEEMGTEIYWRPETDVVVLRHQKEPYVCQESSICNAESPDYEYRFDARVRFVVMPRDVFELGSEGAGLLVSGLEIVFILIEDAPKVKLVKEISSGDVLTLTFKDWAQQEEKVWVQDLTSIFDLKGWRDEVPARGEEDVVVKIVTSLEEVLQFLATWPPQAGRGMA